MAEPVSITNNGDGTHTVCYTPANDGPYMVCVRYADQEVPRRSELSQRSLSGALILLMRV